MFCGGDHSHNDCPNYERYSCERCTVHGRLHPNFCNHCQEFGHTDKTCPYYLCSYCGKCRNDGNATMCSECMCKRMMEEQRMMEGNSCGAAGMGACGAVDMGGAAF